MARKAIKATDVVAKNVFTNAIKGAKTLLDVFGDLKKSIAETGKELESALKEINFDKAEGIVKFNKVLEQTTVLTKDLKDVQVEEMKLAKQKKKLEADALKASKKATTELAARQKAIKDGIALQKKEGKSIKELKAVNKLLAEERDNLNVATEEGEVQAKAITEQIEENTKVINKNTKAEKEKIEVTDDSIKQKIRDARLLKKRKKDLEALVILEEKQVKSIRSLRDANKALRIEAEKIIGDSEEANDQRKKLNDQIDENTEFIKENSDSLVQNKINIGNYTESIEGALDKTGLFGEEIQAVKDGISLVTKVFKKNTVAAKANTKALTRSQKAVKGFGKALRAIGKIGIIAVVAAIASIAASFQSSQRGALEFQKVLATGQAVVNVFITRVTVLARGLTDLFVSLRGEITSVFDGLKKVNNVVLRATGITALLEGASALSDKYKELTGDAEDFNKGNDTKEAIDKIVSAFTDLDQAIKDITDSSNAANKALDLEFNSEPLIEGIQREISVIQQREALLNQVSDSNTLSFDEQQKNLIALDVEQGKRIALERKILIIQKNINDEFIRGEVFANRAAIAEQGYTVTSLESVDELLKIGAVRFELGKDLIKQNQESFLALAENTREETELKEDIAAKDRQRNQDARELTLDFLRDDLDNRKTISERIIGDERKTFEARKASFKDITKLSEDSFTAQIKEIQTFTDKVIDVNALINAESEVEFANTVRRLGISELVAKQLFDTIRDRRTLLQDLAEVEKEVFEQDFRQEELVADLEATNEALENISKFDFGEIDTTGLTKKQIKELKEEIDQFNEDLEAEEKRLAEKRAQNEIDILTKRIAAEKKLLREELAEKKGVSVDEITEAELTSETILALDLDKNNKLLQQQKDRLKSEDEARKKALEEEAKDAAKQLEKEQELRDAAIGAAEAFFEARAEKRIASIDKELEAVQSRQDQLRTLAEQGSKEAVESLALEQRKEAELQIQREKELKSQQRIELSLTALKTFSGKVDANDPQPLQSTFKDLLQLKQFVTAFPGFYEGTDSVGTGDGVKLNTAKDNLLVRVHEGERIMGVSDSKKLQGYTNEGIVSLVKAHEQGVFSDNISVAKVSSPSGRLSIENIEQLSEISATLKNLPNQMPTNSTDYNSLEGMITDVVKTKGSTRRTKMRAGWR